MKIKNLTRASQVLMALMMTAPHITWAQSTQGNRDGSSNIQRPGFNFTLPVETGVTDDDLGQNEGGGETSEPEIRLPIFPPKKPGGQSGIGNGQSNQNRPATNTMVGLDKSAFPGMTCPLVDNRPHKDLLNAVQALSRVVIVTPECQNNTELVKMSEEAKKLVTAGTSLQDLWNNPQQLADNQKSLVDFQNNLNVMLTGINSVTTSLQNNALLDSKCGKQMMTGSGVLVAVSDLISSFAPFALIGASMNPSLGAALPYILGFTGVGSVAKIIKGMSDANTLKMEKSEHRQAVLTNICEFSKISQKIRFLKLAQSGQIETVTQEIQAIKAQSDQVLKSRFSDRVFSIASIRNSAEGQLKKSGQLLTRDMTTYRSAMSQLSNQNDSSLACYVAREIVGVSGNSDTFPTSAITNMARVIELQTNKNLAQTALLNAEKRLRERIKFSINDDSSKAIVECGATARTYLETLGKILTETKQSLTKLNKSLDRQMMRDTEYATFRRNEERAKSEIETLTKVANILEKLNMDNAIIDKMEMDTQVSGLKRALFGTPDGLPMIRGSSPAMAWLNFVDDQFRRSIGAFSTEMSALTHDAYLITKSGRMEFYKRDQNGNVMRDKYGRAVPLSNLEQNQSIIQDIKSSQELANLNPNVAPAGSDNQRVVCQRLENIWLSWAAAVDHLAAQDFFCKNIRGFFDSNTESALVERCVGRQNLAGKILVASEIQKKQSELAAKGLKARAITVSSKMKELTCEMPDAVESMQ